MVKKMGIIIQAHMGSTRLPNKVMKEVGGCSVLGHVIRRMKQVTNADCVIVATSDKPCDDIVVSETERYHAAPFRGSDDDVLYRFVGAAQRYRLSDVVRICSDDVFVDPYIVTNEIELYYSNKDAIVKCGQSVPIGNGGEVFSYTMLKDAADNGHEHYHREHVTPYIYEHYKSLEYNISEEKNDLRLTLDTEEDFQLLEKIYSIIGSEEHSIRKVIEVMQEHPDLRQINKNVHQKAVKE